MLPRRLMSICTVAHRPTLPYVYSLQNKPHLANIQSWEIYVDFMTVCVSGDIRAMNCFHDQHILSFESRLRREDPDLIFRDSALDSFVKITTPVYPRLMGAVEEIIRDRQGSRRTLEWFRQMAALRPNKNTPLQ